MAYIRICEFSIRKSLYHLRREGSRVDISGFWIVWTSLAMVTRRLFFVLFAMSAGYSPLCMLKTKS